MAKISETLYLLLPYHVMTEISLIDVNSENIESKPTDSQMNFSFFFQSYKTKLLQGHD